MKRNWWRRYDVMPPQADEIIQSWDLAFTNTAASAYVVGQVWARNDANIYLLDQVRAKMTFPETVREFLRLSAMYPNCGAKLVEAKANGRIDGRRYISQMPTWQR